jgi:predicted transcriptional regulator
LRKSNLAHIFASNYLRIMTQSRDIFQAIADPTRRQIIAMLARKSLNVNAIAKEFVITRQAVSLHVQFLNDCGLPRDISKNGGAQWFFANYKIIDMKTILKYQKVTNHK